MHVRAMIRAIHSGEELGPFDLPAVPRVEEVVTVPSSTDTLGVRIFEVDEVHYIAGGVPRLGSAPNTPHILVLGAELE